MNSDAIAFLKKCEPRFSNHIEHIGDIELPTQRSSDPFLALIELIAYQQLAGTAARVIWSRVLTLFTEPIPSARALLELSEDQLRAAGLSRSKARSLRRPDIMPSTDYGVRKGIQLLYRKRSLPTPKQVAKLAESWSPHRTTAALYLWRIAAAAKPKKRKAATS